MGPKRLWFWSTLTLVALLASSPSAPATLAAKRARAPDVPADAGDPLAACGPIAKEVTSEFETFVSSHRACRVTSDCALAMAGCPLPCYRAVSSSAVKEVQSLGEELVARAWANNCRCTYKCGPPTFACIRGTCVEKPRT